MKFITQGAEAKIYLDNDQIIKNRVTKNYRIKEIDQKLRISRTKREAKILEKSSINVPNVISIDEKNAVINMEFVEGDLLRNTIDNLDNNKRINIFKTIGKEIRKLHDQGIIHGDITTSNIILKNYVPYFIDFGLGFFSSKIEDKAVDVYLFKQVINAKHYNFLDEFNYVLEGYQADKEFLNRLAKIEARGRYKKK